MESQPGGAWSDAGGVGRQGRVGPDALGFLPAARLAVRTGQAKRKRDVVGRESGCVLGKLVRFLGGSRLMSGDPHWPLPQAGEGSLFYVRC